MNDFVGRKLGLAEALAGGRCGGGTDDAILVLSALMSAIAAVLWPKKKATDRKRFVELWARYADPRLRPNAVSLPLLIEHLRNKGRADVAETARVLRADQLEAIPEFDDGVVSGLQVDFGEDVVNQATGLPVAALREFTYGNLFYRHYRSAYVHEYKVASHGDSFRMSELKSGVVYEGGWMDPPYRRIQMDIWWIIEIVRTVTVNVADDWRKRPLSLPDTWWIDGG